MQEVYAGMGGSASVPLSPSSTRQDLQEIGGVHEKEASLGGGRGAVAVLLQRMLRAAKHDTVSGGEVDVYF